MLCGQHLDSLPMDCRSLLQAATQAAIAVLAAERMRRAVAALPKETQDRMREETRDL